jgi:hypothetical protein
MRASRISYGLGRSGLTVYIEMKRDGVRHCAQGVLVLEVAIVRTARQWNLACEGQ